MVPTFNLFSPGYNNFENQMNVVYGCNVETEKNIAAPLCGRVHENIPKYVIVVGTNTTTIIINNK